MRHQSLVPVMVLLVIVLPALQIEVDSVALRVLTDLVSLIAIGVLARVVVSKSRAGIPDGDADRLNELEPLRPEEEW